MGLVCPPDPKTCARVGLSQLPRGLDGPWASCRAWGDAALSPSGAAVACSAKSGGGAWVAGLGDRGVCPRWKALPTQGPNGLPVEYTSVSWTAAVVQEELLVTQLSKGVGLAFHRYQSEVPGWGLCNAISCGGRGRGLLLKSGGGSSSCSFFIEDFSGYLRSTCSSCKDGLFSLLAVETERRSRSLFLFAGNRDAGSISQLAIVYTVELWGLQHVQDVTLRQKGEENFCGFTASREYIFGLCPSGSVSGFLASTGSKVLTFSAKSQLGLSSLRSSFDKLAVGPDGTSLVVGGSTSRVALVFGTDDLISLDSGTTTHDEAQKLLPVVSCAADMISATEELLPITGPTKQRHLRSVHIVPTTCTLESLAIVAGNLIMYAGEWTYWQPLNHESACKDDRSAISGGKFWGRPILLTRRHFFSLNDCGIEICTLSPYPRQPSPPEPSYIFPRSSCIFEGLDVGLLLQLEIIFGSAVILRESGTLSGNDALVRILLLKKCLELNDSVNFQQQLKAVASGPPAFTISAIQHVLCAALERRHCTQVPSSKVQMHRVLKYASSSIAKVLRSGDFGSEEHERMYGLAAYLKILRKIGNGIAQADHGKPQSFFVQRTFKSSAPSLDHSELKKEISRKSERRSTKRCITEALQGGCLSRAIGELRSSGTSVSGSFVRNVALEHCFGQLVLNEPEAATQTLLAAGLAPVKMFTQLIHGSVSRIARNSAAAALENMGNADIGKEINSENHARLEILETAYPCEDFQQAVSWNRSSHPFLDSAGHTLPEPFTPYDYVGCTVGGWPFKQSTVARLDTRPNNFSGASPGTGGHCNFLKISPSWLSYWSEEEDNQMLLEAAFLTCADASTTPVPWAARLQFCVAHSLEMELEKLLSLVTMDELVPGALRIAGPGSNDGDIMVQVLGADVLPFSCGYIRRLLEEKLSASGTFLQLYWPSPIDFVAYMARSRALSTRNLDKGRDGLMEKVACASAEMCDSLQFHNVLWAILSSPLFEQDRRIPSLLRQSVALKALAKWMLASKVPGYEMRAGFLSAKCLWGECAVPSTEEEDLQLSGAGLAAKNHPLAFLGSYVYRQLNELPRHEDLETALTKCRTRFPVLKTTLRHLERLRGTSHLSKRVDNTHGASKAWESWHYELLLGSSARDWSCLDYLPPRTPSPVRHLIHGLLQGPRAAQAAALWSKVALSTDSSDYEEVFVRGAVAWEVETWNEAKKNFFLQPDASPALAIQTLLQHGRSLGALSCFARIVGEHSLDVEEIVLSARRTAALHYHNAPAAAASCLILELLGEPVQAWCARLDIAALQEIESQALGPGGQGGLGAAAAASLAQALVSSSEARREDEAEGRAAAQQLVDVICEGASRRLRADPSADSRESAGRAWRLARSLSESHGLAFSTDRDLVFLSGLAERGDWLRLLGEATALRTSPDILAAAVQSLPSAPTGWHILHALDLHQSYSATSAYNKVPGECTPELFAYTAAAEKAANAGEASLQTCQSLWRDAVEMRWPLLACIASTALPHPAKLPEDRVNAEDRLRHDRSHSETLRVAAANAYAWLCATAPPDWPGMPGGAPESAAVLLSGNHNNVMKRLAFAAREVAQTDAGGPPGAALIRSFELSIGGIPGGAAAIDSARAVRDFAHRRSPLQALRRLRTALLDSNEEVFEQEKDGNEWPGVVAVETLVGAMKCSWESGRAGEFLGNLVQSRLLGHDLPGAPPEPCETDPDLLRILRPLALAVALLDQSELQGDAVQIIEERSVATIYERARDGSLGTIIKIDNNAVLNSLECAGRWDDARIWANESRCGGLEGGVTLRQARQYLHRATVDPYAWSLSCVRDAALMNVESLLCNNNLPVAEIVGFLCSLAWRSEAFLQNGATLTLEERSKVLLSAAAHLGSSDESTEPCRSIILRKSWLLQVESGHVDDNVPVPPLDVDENLDFLERFFVLEMECIRWLMNGIPVLGQSEGLLEGILNLLDKGHLDWADILASQMQPQPFQLSAVLGALRLWRWGSFDPKMSLSEFLPGDVEMKVLSHLEQGAHFSRLGYIDNVNLRGFSRAEILQAIGAACGPGKGQRICEKLAVAVSTKNVLKESLDTHMNVLQRPLKILSLLLEYGVDGASVARNLVKAYNLDHVSVARCVSETLKKSMAAVATGSQSVHYPDDLFSMTEVCDCPLELGNALLGIVLEGRDLHPDVEADFILMANHYYKVAGTVDGLEVLVTLARERCTNYVESRNFRALARLAVGLIRHPEMHVGIDMLVKNDRIEELLKRRVATGPFGNSSREVVLRTAIMASLQRCRPGDQEAMLMLYHHFGRSRRIAEIAQEKSHKIIQAGKASNSDKDLYPLFACGISQLADAASGFEAAGCPRSSRKCSQEAHALAKEVLRTM